jgi:hypothetical protein
MRTCLLLGAIALVGCSGPDPATDYLGTWTFASGTDNVTCPTGTTAQALTGNITIKKGTASDLVVLDAEACNFAYTLTGTAATTANAMCTRPAPEVGTGVTAATTFSNITLNTADAKTMTDTFAGTVAFTSSAGTLNCTFSGSAMLNKIAE